MDAKRQRPSPTSPAGAAVISKVLEDDDLLGEVLIRVIFPTTLVRAALVCRRWLRVASDPAFLRRFRDLHPPRLLGVYVITSKGLRSTSRFMPAPHPPTALAAVVRRAGTIPELASGVATKILDCQNGRLLVELDNRATMRIISPLHLDPAQDATVILPLLPPLPVPYFRIMRLNTDGEANTILWGLVQRPRQVIFQVHELQDGSWHSVITSPELKFPVPLSSVLISHPDDGRIYLMCCASDIATLPSALSKLSYISIIALPDGVECKHRGKLKPRVDDSGIYLVHVKDLQLHVWIYMTNDRKWLLHDIICLREVCGNSSLANLASGHGLSAATTVKVHEVGHSAEFVLLQVGVDVLYVNVKSRTAEKVYTVAPEDGSSIKLIPFMMLWPPIFPSINEDSTEKT